MFKKKKKINLHLSGGLGNQLFQYAFAKSISIHNDTDLHIDNYTGFLLDKTYKRELELDHFLVIYNKISFLSFVKFIMLKINQRLFKPVQKKILTKFYGNYLFELDYEPIDFNTLKNKDDLWIFGYWQNPNYFYSIKQIILKELSPPPSSNNLFKELAQKIENSNAVAIGVRLYEETANPEILSNTGLVKTINDINGVIDKINKTILNPCYFIFCSHRSKSLENLLIANNAVFVTPDDGFEDAVDTLWLLSKCQHHVFTNSTFYWWGAFLSSNNFNKDQQHIYAADNFLNQNVYLDNWYKF
jgi:hypothetical protein